jgi:hypothetical protein
MAKRQRTMRDMLFRAGAVLFSLQIELFQATLASSSSASSTSATVSNSIRRAEKLKKWQDSWF